MDYFDILLAKKLEDDRDPKVEGLSVSANGRYHEDGVVYDPVIVNVPETPLSKLTVTENGTYTAPTGTAYSEVDVNVPLPENAYLLKEIEDVEIASFTDGSDLPMPKLEVGIEPVQDLHGYDYPWAGGAGRNLFDMSVWQGTTASGLSFVVDEDFVTINGTKSGGTYVTPSGNFKTLSSGTYYAKAFVIGGTASNAPSIYIYTDSDLTSNIIGSEKSFTLESDTSVKFRFAFWSDGATFSNYKIGIVISRTPNIDTFAPYSNICPISGWDEVNVTVADATTDPTVSNVYTIDLDGTRYGGKVDLISGVMTVDRVYKDLGDYDWTADPITGLFRTNDNTLKYMSNIISSQYVGVKNLPLENMPDGSLQCTNTQALLLLRVRDFRFDGKTATEVKTMLTGAQMVAELATPLTIQLTPTQVKSLLGSNNVWADSGDILDLSYLAKEV